MNTQKKRIQPYFAEDGDYVTLVDFLVEAAHMLWPSFSPPQQWSDRKEESVPHEYDIVRVTYGDGKTGFAATHKMGYEPRGGGHAEDDVVVTCYGLPEGMTLEIQTLRYYHDPRFVEIRVVSPEERAEAVLARFEARFSDADVPSESEVKYLMAATISATRVHAWRSAEFNALAFLKIEPHNAEALMYLGIARAAQGFEPEGEGLLLSSITMDPKNADAYYNLGLIALNQGRCLAAADFFRHGLRISPGKHAMFFQLGRALERMGRLDEALLNYQQSVTHSPDPKGTWGYCDMDFSQSARESIGRVEQVMKGDVAHGASDKCGN